jgi:D-sedoheptulose 7-phosphate isomerase
MEDMEYQMKDSDFLTSYFKKIQECLDINKYIENLIESKYLIENTSSNNKKLIIIGNGGSASIASHMAIDFSKNAKIKSVCFNDAALITCLSNDYGHDNWMLNAIKIYGEPGDTLIAISSSGMSENILNASKFSCENNINVITFTGMNKNNKLNKIGQINFWVDSQAYNIIETSHQLLISSLVDIIIGAAEYPA